MSDEFRTKAENTTNTEQYVNPLTGKTPDEYYDWTTNDSVHNDDDNVSFTNVTENETENFEEEGVSVGNQSSALKTEASALSEATIPEAITGQGLSYVNSAIVGRLANNLSTNVREGFYDSDHRILSDVTADMRSSNMEFYGNLGNAAITVGSMFGPEGFLVGGLAAAALDAYGYETSQTIDAQVDSTSGAIVNA